MNVKTFPGAFCVSVFALFAPVMSVVAEPLVHDGETVAFLGDSITYYGNSRPLGFIHLVTKGLEAVGVRIETIPAGLGGHKSSDLLSRLEADVLSKKPQWMTLSCGVNDVYHAHIPGRKGVPLADYRRNMTEILDRCAAAGVKVLLLTPTMITEDPDDVQNVELEAYCDWLRQVAAERALPLADLNAAMRAEVSRRKMNGKDSGNALTWDGIHMIASGDELLARVILATMGVGEEDARVRQSWKDYRELSGRARLAENGKTEYSIVLSPSASPCDRFAAEELQRFLGEATAANFPIVNDGRTIGLSAIELGTERARQIVGSARVRSLREEECVYKVTADGTIAIVGRGSVGNAYGVYAFLERELGCRWFSKTGDNLVPKHGRLELAPTEHAEKPAYEYRTVLCCDSGKADASSDLFYFRNRLNMRDFSHCPDSRLAGILPVRLKDLNPTCHSFFVYVPPDKYFNEHPEFFTQEKGGARTGNRQLCFSNRELRRTLTENFIHHAREAGGKGFLDLSQMDMDGPLCWCAGCQALSEKFDSPGGPFFDYLLEEAPKIKAACPDIILHFLAYHRDTTQKPPKMKIPFPDNVAVVFAPLDDDFSKPIDHPNNIESFRNLQDWCKLCRVWLWNYPQSYAAGPIPYTCLSRTAADLRLDFDAGARGAYVEHDACRETGANFFDLQLWMLMQAYRNPHADWKSLRKEFCDFYYAPVAREMLAYANFLETNIVAGTEYIDFSGRSDAFLSADELVRWQRRFDIIEHRVGDNADVLQRVREARLSLDVSTLMQYGSLHRAGLDFPMSARALYDRIRRTWRTAVDRRYDRTDRFGRDWRRKFLDDSAAYKALDTKLFLATTEIKPLPRMFDKVPRDRITQEFPQTSDRFVARERMDDAATGYAQVELDPGEEGRRFPFSIGLYDKGCGKTVLSRKIPASEVEWNRFKFYKLGRCPLPSASCMVWMGRSWRLSANVGAAYRPGLGPDDLFDVYVSLKFVGDDCSRVYYDRVVLIGPNADGCP